MSCKKSKKGMISGQKWLKLVAGGVCDFSCKKRKRNQGG